jgi:carboxypeptidase Q
MNLPISLRRTLALLLLSQITVITVSLGQSSEKVDAAAMARIREEGLTRSHVMDYAFHLTDGSGPRVTNSAAYMRAANWAVEELKKIGAEKAALEAWGDFGKGWDLQKSYVAMTAPYYKPIIGIPKVWTKGTGGLQHAELVVIEARDSTGLQAYAGKLKGKVVLVMRTDTLKQTFKADATRFTDEDLVKMANAPLPPPPAKPSDTAQQRRNREAMARFMSGNLIYNQARDFAEKEGAVAVLSANPRGHDGTIFVQGSGVRTAYTSKAPEAFTDVVIAAEDYYMLTRLGRSGVPVSLDLDVQSTFQTSDPKGYNVVAEIKGSDPKLAPEIVMIGAHLDSWQGATGATDNAAGSSVMIEAIRILKATGVKLRRTVRIALWSGEEQGLFGSRGYVKNHFADPADMVLKPEHGMISGYFNIDNGTGKVRGIYTQGNEKVKDIFAEWLKPFADLGATTVTLSNTGGTDHQAFDAVGIPGFQFIQDPIEYDTRTHHTNMDSYDHLIPDDLKQIATIVAAFVYNTANRDEKLPRKELPAARPGGMGF